MRNFVALECGAYERVFGKRLERRSFSEYRTRMKAATLVVLLSLAIPYGISANDSAHPEDPLVIVQNGKYGFIDHAGVVVIAPQYLWANGFCGRTVAIDAAGRISPPSAVHPHDLFPTSKDGRTFFVGASGQRVGNADFDDAAQFSDALAAVKIGGKWGYVDETGKIVIEPRFDEAYRFLEGVASAKLSGDFVVIDRSGKVLARGYGLTIGVVSEGRIPVSKDDKFGYLDLRGNLAIPLIYDSGDSFGDGLAPVSSHGKWGYINREGKTIIPFVFDSAGSFGHGLAAVHRGLESGFIDKSGRFAFRLQFQYASGFGKTSTGSDVSAFWTDDSRFGYVTTSGKVIWGPTTESPSHGPLFGWSEEDKVESCKDVPQSVRDQAASFPAAN
jgi:WG containing repeat